MDRRQYLTATVVSVTGALAGCSGDNNPQDTSGDNNPQDTGSNDSSGIQIEYSLSDPKTSEEVPSEVVEHPNPEGFYWIVVEFQLVSGSFDASDIMGLTQIEAGESSHFTRAVIIISPDEMRLTSSDDEYSMPEGTRGRAYYRLSDHPEDPVWVVEQLRNQHGSIETTQI